jgi:hypothetical protein
LERFSIVDAGRLTGLDAQVHSERVAPGKL